jgi:ABC-type ATPase with predicted acetyltransferase domain
METRLKCPKCGSVIYSRRKPVCGRCGEKLPDALLFDPATRRRVEKLIAQERKQAEWASKFPGHPSSSSECGPFFHS